LWENVDFAGSRIQRFLQNDIEFLLLGAGAVIGQVEAFLDDRIDVG